MLTKAEMPACPVATTVQLIGEQMETSDYTKPDAAPLALQ